MSVEHKHGIHGLAKKIYEFLSVKDLRGIEEI